MFEPAPVCPIGVGLMDECVAFDAAAVAKCRLPVCSRALLGQIAQDICVRLNAASAELGCKAGVSLGDMETEQMFLEAARAAYSTIALAAGATPRKLKGGVDA